MIGVSATSGKYDASASFVKYANSIKEAPVTIKLVTCDLNHFKNVEGIDKVFTYFKGKSYDFSCLPLDQEYLFGGSQYTDT